MPVDPMLQNYLLVGLLVLIVWLSRPSRYKLPPGPLALPIIGSVHRLPLEFQEKTFWDWRRVYGDVVFLKLFRTPTIVINTLAAARELLDKRSAKYSDRPRMVLLAEIQGHHSSLPPMPYGDRFRKHRKWVHDGVGSKKALLAYQPIIIREAKILIEGLLVSPDDFSTHFYRYVAATVLEITYGRKLTSQNDELMVLAERSTTATNDCGSPGSMIVDFFPFMKHLPGWVPGCGFQRLGEKARLALEEWRNTAFNIVKLDMTYGTGSPCVISSILEAHGEDIAEDEIEDIKGVGISIFGAGTETTHTTLMSFLLAMVRYPDVFRKAQQEMDRVVGRGRFPAFEDRELMPYLNAILEEVYRWAPALSLSVPHRLMSDDKYHGYDIPEGCMVMPNIWGMTRDLDFYNDPEEFLPERHLDMRSGVMRRDKEMPSSYTFGFGRRICPGQAFADQTLWLAMASIIATFDVRRPLDEEGREVTPPANFRPGFTRRTEPFKCRIRMRRPGISTKDLMFEP